jgi:CTP:molybdopterin cytidylyltransferase MocA
VHYRGAVVTRVAGILLAAGDGTRLGQPKATVELNGGTLAERGVALLRAGGADPVLVVTGAVPVDIAGTRTVHNPDWPSGMGSSLAAALRALDAGGAAGDLAGVSAAVIALADQPLIGPEAARRLIAAYGAGATVAVAAYHGKPRNPVLIAREHWPEVVAMATGDAGARPFLRAHPELVTIVECGDTGSPDDIDTPEDLARVRAAVSRPVTGPDLLGLTYWAWTPQRTVTEPRGGKTIRSSPLTNAFGGQVIGSTATAARRRSSSSGSLVKTWSQVLAASIHMAVVSPPPVSRTQARPSGSLRSPVKAWSSCMPASLRAVRRS